MENALLQLRRLIGLVLRVQPGEGRKTVLMSALMFCLVGFLISGRVIRDSLFLSRYSVEYLPALYIWVALGVCIQSFLYSRVADRVRRDRLVFAGASCVLAATLLARISLGWVGDWFYPVFYVFIELAGTLLVIQGWTLANDIFTTREGKRLFGLVGGGGVISSVVLGMVVRLLVKRVGTGNLLFLSAALLVGALAILMAITRQCRSELVQALVSPAKKQPRLRLASGWQKLFGTRELLGVALITSVVGIVVTLVDYQFKLGARQAFSGAETSLTSFLGGFWAVTGGISCIIQFFVTSRLLERRGILFGLLLLPLSLLGGTAAILLAPALLTVTLLKGADAVFRYTVSDASLQLLYLPIPAAFRGRAKAFVDGMLRPLSMGLSGALLLLSAPGFPSSWLGWGLLLLLLLWIGFALYAHRAYYRSLMQTLEKNRFRFGEVSEAIPDEAAARVLEKALQSPDTKVVLQALEMLRLETSFDWSPVLRRLLKHEAAEVRRQALIRISQVASLSDGPEVFRLLKDENALVRAAAVEAYCAIGKSRAIRTVARLLYDSDRDVQAATLVGLIRYGGLDGVLMAAERLKSLLESQQAEERALGARILGNIGVKNFYQPLIGLMVDEDVSVRLEAIRAAGKMQNAELLPALVYRLEERTCRTAAMEALVLFGERAVRLLSRTLANSAEPLSVRIAVAQVLSRIGGQAALDMLLERLEEPAWHLRDAVLEAVHRLLLRQPHLKADSALVHKALGGELRELARLWQYLSKLDPPPGELLRDALAGMQQRVIRRIFRLLGCLYPVQTVDLVFRNLNSSSRPLRSNAIELLDGLLPRHLKKAVLPLFDESLREEREAAVLQLIGRPPANAEEILKQMLAAPEPWLVVCSLYEIGISERMELLDEVLLATASDHPLVRETALLVYCRLADRERSRLAAERHKNDKDMRVRMLARHLASVSMA